MTSHAFIIDPTPGARCWVALEYRLKRPEGLRPGAEGVVISVDGSRCVVEVDGKRWVVDGFDIDCGYEFKTRSGALIPEGDPRVKKWLLRRLDWLKGERPAHIQLDAWEHELAWVKHLLERNGW